MTMKKEPAKPNSVQSEINADKIGIPTGDSITMAFTEPVNYQGKTPYIKTEVTRAVFDDETWDDAVSRVCLSLEIAHETNVSDRLRQLTDRSARNYGN